MSCTPWSPLKRNGSKSVSIGELSFREASLTIRDAQRGFALSLPKWSGKVKDLDPDGYRIELAAEAGGSFEYQRRSLRLDRLAANLDYSDKSIVIRSAQVDSPALRIVAKGSIEGLKSGKLHLESTGDSSVLATLAGFGGRIRGSHTVALDLSGELAQPDVRGRLETRDFYFDGYGPVRAKADFQTRGALSRAAIDSFDAQWGEAAIRGSADVALKESAGESRVRAQFGGLRSSELARLAAVANPPVSSIASGSADLRFPALRPDVGNVRGVAALRLDAAAGPIPLAGDLRLVAEAGRTAISIASLRGLAATASGDVEIRNGSALAGTLQLSAPDASALLAALKTSGFLQVNLASVKGAIDGIYAASIT